MKALIRRAAVGDLEAILDIQRRAYAAKEAPLYGNGLPPLFETVEDLAAEMNNGTTVLVVENDGCIAGSVRVILRPGGEAHWGRLSVDPALQGKGIGQTLVRAVETEFSDAAFYSLDCGDKSEENFYIYKKLGYERNGESLQVANGPLCHVMVKQNIKP